MAITAYKKPHIPNFKKVVAAFSDAPKIIEEEVRDFAEDEREAFQRRIELQDFPSFNAAPLSPAYAKRKERLGLDPRVMIATGYYYKEIRVFRRKVSKRAVTLYIGHHKRAQARDHKDQRVPILLNTLAAVHEKGSAKMNIPPRPHWGPHLALMRTHAQARRQAIRARIRARVKGKLGKLAGG